ncbi:Trehalase [Filimonas lacunae]|uniref:Trehalase n=1 Tax=Filimonas lacunae TaxID=477680 RepID=A0A173MCC7_9BACT|nr:glycosyl hydrolase family 65 protein [Filimonas lacunae]BAV05186.1 hypothetical protein FLA_1193 [Filimonas lacunae]SIT22733.1 Trehalase [Filimonas lacunae]
MKPVNRTRAILIIALLVGLSGGSLSGLAQQRKGALLTTIALEQYVNRFNAIDTQDVQNYIPDAKALEFLSANVPLFVCPDSVIEKIYYYRWWTFRKHLKQTPDGFIFTEFITPVKHAGKHNSVSSALGHHIYEGRWLLDTQYINQYVRFWLQLDKTFKAPRLHGFSGWVEDAVYQLYKVQQDIRLVRSLYHDMDTEYVNWEKERLLSSGLFWQYDVKDAMEESISGGRKVKNMRPSINSYMYGNAVAMAQMGKLLKEDQLHKQYEAKAIDLRKLIQDSLWDDKAEFFKTRLEKGGLSDAREAIGFIPWYFNLPANNGKYTAAWKQLTDTAGFWAPWGLTTAERRHPGFRTHGTGHSCEWDGAVWPFASTQTLKAFSNLLNNYKKDATVPGAAAFLQAMHTYALSHQKNGDAYIGEYQDEKTGYWLKGDNERSSFYNHSGFADLVISDLVGLKPAEGNTVVVAPLLPEGAWDWFCLDKVAYHGKILTIIWDKTGTHFNKGKGFQLWVNGKKVAQSVKLNALKATI